MIKKVYKAIDNPLGFVMLKSKPKIHDVVTTFDEFNDNQKRKLLYFKDVIISKIGDCEMAIFGSQIKGNWDETSDFDIAVFKVPSKEDAKYLNEFDYGFKVDMFFIEGDKYYERAVNF